jgi:hypothetical protein
VARCGRGNAKKSRTSHFTCGDMFGRGI